MRFIVVLSSSVACLGGVSLSHDDDDDDDDDDDEPPLGRCREESAASLRIMPFSKRLFVPKHDNVESEGKSTTTALFDENASAKRRSERGAPRLAQSVVVFVWNDWKKRGKKKRSGPVRPSRTNTRFSIETYGYAFFNERVWMIWS